MILIFLAGLLPAFLLVLHIYKADKLQPEPLQQIVRACKFGVFSILLSFFFSFPFQSIGLYTHEYTSVIGALRLSLFGAAIPEEIAKFLMLLLVVRNNRYFDEKMDGIVYAVCVGMGFAAFENVLYLFQAGDSWVNVSITRALLAVPCHYYCAVFMGYFFSLYCFDREAHKIEYLFWTLAAPIITHCLYDFIVMSLQVIDSTFAGVILSIFLFFTCFQFLKWSRKRVEQHLQADKNTDYHKQERSANDQYDRDEKA